MRRNKRSSIENLFAVAKQHECNRPVALQLHQTIIVMHDKSCGVSHVCENTAWALLLILRSFDGLKRSHRSNKDLEAARC